MKPEVHLSVADGDRAAIATLYGDRAEGPGYMEAGAQAGSGQQRFITVTDQGGLVAASPGFITRFNWLSILPGARALAQHDPAISRISMAGLGLIQASELGSRIDPTLDITGQQNAFGAVLDGLETLGKQERVNFVLVKDLNDRDAAIGEPLLRSRGFARMGALPLAYLHLPFTSMDRFLASLSRNRRRSLMRNVARASQVEVETGADISALGQELHALGEQTRRHAATQFSGLEATPKNFLANVQKLAAKNCWFFLYRLEGELIGFSFNLFDSQTAFGKIIGLSYPQALEHKVYFLNLFKTIENCIEMGIKWLSLGQLAYETKLALGCKLERRWLYLKGRGLFRPGFALASPVMTRLPLDPLLKPFDRPENYFASNPDGPQPPVNRVFNEI